MAMTLTFLPKVMDRKLFIMLAVMIPFSLLVLISLK